jgi:hypothetical protein
LAKDKSKDKKDRRSGIKRRQYEFALHIPERRKGEGRRREDKEQKPDTLEEDNNLKKGDQKKAKNKKN